MVILLSALTGCRIGNTDFVLGTEISNNRTIFRINGDDCSIKQARIYLCNYKNLYGNAYGIDLWEYEFQRNELEQYIKDVTIAELAQIVCMDMLAKEQGISLDKEEKSLAHQAAEEYYESLTKEEKSFMDVRKGDLEKAYENYALAQKLYATLTKGIDEEVSDDEARVIRVQQIYVSNRSNADTIALKLANGEEFSAVAGTYNESGLVETTVSRGVYPKAVEDVAFNLDDGASSGMIEVEEGYYFIKCLNKYEEELTEANKDNILVQREKELFEDVYKNFVTSASFELNDRLWEKTTFEGVDNITTDSFFEVYNKYFKK